MKQIVCLAMLVVALVLASVGGVAARPISEEVTDRAWVGPVFVDSTEILLQESFPVQVMLLVQGHLPTPCHQPAWAVQDLGDSIDVRLWSEADPAQTCVQVLEPFEVSIPLGSYESADTVVTLNGDPVGRIEIGTPPTIDESELAGAGWSFGMCGGYCNADLVIDGDELVLSGASHVVEEPLYVNHGTLTRAGRERIDAALERLDDIALKPTYGCPDCADGGAAYLTIERLGKSSRHDMQSGAPPDVLAELHALSFAIIDGLETCQQSELISVSDDCAPYLR